jgi:hypothetical protein
MKPSDARPTLDHVRAQLDTITDRITPAISNVREWSARGYPSTSGPIGGGRGQDTSNIERLVTAGISDPFHDDLRHALAHLAAARANVDWLVRFVHRNTELHELEPGLIDCANPSCDRTMTGIRDDRPRDGRCERCYRWRRRHGTEWPHGREV